MSALLLEEELVEVEWSVFVINRFEPDEIVHVAPTVSGALMNPHRLSPRCPCKPIVEDGDNTVVIHNMIH